MSQNKILNKANGPGVSTVPSWPPNEAKLCPLHQVCVLFYLFIFLTAVAFLPRWKCDDSPPPPAYPSISLTLPPAIVTSTSELARNEGLIVWKYCDLWPLWCDRGTSCARAFQGSRSQSLKIGEVSPGRGKPSIYCIYTHTSGAFCSVYTLTVRGRLLAQDETAGRCKRKKKMLPRKFLTAYTWKEMSRRWRRS